MVAILLAQAVVAPVDFDLAKLPTMAPKCGRGGSDEIVVCKAPDRRLHSPDPRYGDKAVRAIAGLGGGSTIDAHVEKKALAPGVVSQRAMVTLSFPFGAGKK